MLTCGTAGILRKNLACQSHDKKDPKWPRYDKFQLYFIKCDHHFFGIDLLGDKLNRSYGKLRPSTGPYMAQIDIVRF